MNAMPKERSEMVRRVDEAMADLERWFLTEETIVLQAAAGGPPLPSNQLACDLAAAPSRAVPRPDGGGSSLSPAAIGVFHDVTGWEDAETARWWSQLREDTRAVSRPETAFSGAVRMRTP